MGHGCAIPLMYIPFKRHIKSEVRFSDFIELDQMINFNVCVSILSVCSVSHVVRGGWQRRQQQGEVWHRR